MYIVEFYASPSGKTVVRDIYFSLSEKTEIKNIKCNTHLKRVWSK